MIVAAVAFVAVASQAATVKWVSAASGDALGVDVATVGDNGDYAASGSALKNNSTLSFVMTFYEAGTKNVVDTWEADVKFKATGDKIISVQWANADNDLEQNTTYDYVVTVTGTQKDLAALGTKDGYIYDAAKISATASGSIKTESSGTTQLTQGFSTWTVSGVQSVPEPTSGLLLLLGVAGLALRRRRA